jgi:hypothetical protein
LAGGSPKRGSPSIIRATCAFESKNRGVLERLVLLSAYDKRDKKFFRKILFFHFLLSKCAEKTVFFSIFLTGFEGFIEFIFVGFSSF